MTTEFNDKHLLWWVLVAVNQARPLLTELTWKDLGAPDWVLPALRNKVTCLQEWEDRGGIRL